MPILAGSKKALRSSQRKAVINRKVKSKVKTAVDAFKAKPTAVSMAEAMSAIDRAVKSHIFHRNKAARLKRQLSKLMPKTELGKKLVKKAVSKAKPKAKKTALVKKAVSKAKPKAKKATSTKKSVAKKKIVAKK